MKVAFTDSAKADLQDLRRYILKFKPAGTWLNVKQQFQECIAHLAKFPESGSMPDELAEYANGFRQCLTNQQRVIYKVTGDILYIHVICGQAQDLHDVLIKRLTRP